MDRTHRPKKNQLKLSCEAKFNCLNETSITACGLNWTCYPFKIAYQNDKRFISNGMKEKRFPKTLIYLVKSKEKYTRTCILEIDANRFQGMFYPLDGI